MEKDQETCLCGTVPIEPLGPQFVMRGPRVPCHEPEGRDCVIRWYEHSTCYQDRRERMRGELMKEGFEVSIRGKRSSGWLAECFAQVLMGRGRDGGCKRD
ncbi:hypothetical protein KM043_005769 [Ampulex compressa]|nr:hypothetical protein KM043_005769 [Ampulex compressa]